MAFFPLLLTQSYAIQPKDLVVESKNSVQMTIPARSLAEGSVKISVTSGHDQTFTNWSIEARTQTWDDLQRILHAWQRAHPPVSDFFIYGKAVRSAPFSWEIVPYPKHTWAFWQRLRVLWRIVFGASHVPEARQKCSKNLLQKSLISYRVPSAVVEEDVRHFDPFCQPAVLEKQMVFKGKEIYVLYNFAPIRLGGEELHFLLVPIAHRSSFVEVSQSEYLECQTIASRIVQFYQRRGIPTAYLFDKTGKRAGQTVLHWHQHLIFTQSPMDDWRGKWSVFCRMLFGASPLPARELQRRVVKLRSDLAEELSLHGS